MKRKDLHDARNAIQKFYDQIYGAPEYTFLLTRTQINDSIKGLESIEDKDWRIKDLIKSLNYSLDHVNKIDNNEIFTIKLDTSNVLLLKNFINLNKDMCSEKVTTDGFTTMTERW